MNVEHLKALLKLRFQLSRNQIRKAGSANAVFSILLVVFALSTSFTMFFVALVAGIVLLPQATPAHQLIVWNIVIALFLCVWLIGLLVELQQVEYLSLDKLLHLPISLREAFFLNYTSSYINTAVVMFVPMLAGLSIAMIVVRGPVMLLVPLLLIAFLFFMTTITYQFRGWLARLMENKRRRGTILVVLTMGIVLISQIPNAITMRQDRVGSSRREREEQLEADQRLNLGSRLTAEVEAGKISEQERSDRLVELEERLTEDRESRRIARRNAGLEIIGEIAQAVDLVFPPGWLPYAVFSLERQNYFPVWMALAGMTWMGCASLYLTYRTTLRMYTGVESGKPRTKRTARAAGAVGRNFLLRKLPLVSEHQSAVTLGSFRSLSRAPETKMALLVPMIIAVIFGSMLITLGKIESPEWSRPFIPILLYLVTMFGMSQIVFNLFGTDRGGFRAYVLSPLSRRDILIGKNLSVLPFSAGLCLTLLAIFQFTNPMKVSQLAASLIQLPTTILLICLLGNMMSIFFPFGIARGTMKPAQIKASTIFATMFALLLSAVLCFPALLLAGVEAVSGTLLKLNLEPFYLLASMVEFSLVIWLYRRLIKIQGNWLERYETRILDSVANVPE